MAVSAAEVLVPGGGAMSGRGTCGALGAAGMSVSGAFRSVATSAVLVSTAMPAWSAPSAAFPPEKPAASAEPPAVSRQKAAPARPPASSARSATCPRPPLAYPRQRPLYYPPPAPSLSLVGFTSGAPHTRFAIEFAQNRRVLGWCNDWCWVHLWPGRYRVDVAPSKGVLGGWRPFTVDGPALVTVIPRSHRSSAWLAVGIGSPVLIVGAPIALMAYMGKHENDREINVTVPLLLGFAFLAGAALLPISWIEWERSSRPTLTVEKLAR